MGKRGPKVDKPWSDALRLAALRESDDQDGTTYLHKIAEQCVLAAVKGDIQAIKEIGDRLDGKAKQESDVTVRNGDLADLVEEIRERGLTIFDDPSRENEDHASKPH